MSKTRLLILVGLCAALIPSLASAGLPTGSCYFTNFETNSASMPLFPDGKGFIGATCIDDMTEADCDLLYAGQADWQTGLSCVERDTPFPEWDGSCSRNAGDPFGVLCYLLWIEPQQNITAQEVCEQKGQGTWFDDFTCGLGVPATPVAGLVVMALLLLAISLAVLTFKGPSA